MHRIPLVVRIAGIPAAVLDQFVSPRCVEEVAYIWRVLVDLDQIRKQAVEDLYMALPEIPEALRGKALALKRDCFNGRSLLSIKQTEWEYLPFWIQDTLDKIVHLEAESEYSKRRLASIYEGERRSARYRLQDCLSVAAIDRGIALASSELLDSFNRLGGGAARHDRKSKKVERSFLRYISRAAAKLSPFSTLTRIALGSTVEDPVPGGLKIIDGPWSESSLVRAKRYVIEQCREALFLHPRIRESLLVTINSSVEEMEPGLFKFLRPIHLQMDTANRRLRYSQPSRVSVRLQGFLVEWLKIHLIGRKLVYRDLLSAIQQEFLPVDYGDSESDCMDRIRGVVEKFLDIGFLTVLPPWPTHAPHQERCLLSFLRVLPEGALEDVQPVVETLSEIVRKEIGYHDTENASSSVSEINDLTQELFKRIRDSFPGYAMHFDIAPQNYYEDVFVQAPVSCRTRCGEIVHVNREVAEDLLEAGSLLWTVRSLYEHRHEFLFSVFKFCEDLGSGREEIPFLEFFAKAEPLWQEYVSHYASGGAYSFNPYGLRVIDELDELRGNVRRELTASLEHSAGKPGCLSLPLASLRALVKRIPDCLRPPVGPCLFVQAADSNGEVWVANRFFEGNGRLSSRFGVAMGESAKNWYVEHFTERSFLRFKGEVSEIVDVLYTRSNTVNSHWPQTRRVVEIPGEFSGLPENRVLKLSDLVVRLEPMHQEVSLRDREGRRLIPAFLSAVQEPYTPTLVKFLTFLGANPRVYFDIDTPIKRNGSISEVDRVTVGRLVIRRKRWLVAPGAVRGSDLSDHDCFLAVNLWRRSVGLPDQVYVIEPVTSKANGDKSFKPQYINFGSPLFVEIFKSIVESCGEDILTIEEALPCPEAFPVRPGGVQVGVEVILESLAFMPADSNDETELCPRGHWPEASPSGEIINELDAPL